MTGRRNGLTERRGRFVTPRSVLLGCLLCVASGIAGPYWTFYLQSSRMFADYHTAGASFLLFALVVVLNFGVGRLWRRLALQPEELMAVGAMLLVGGAVVSSGLVGYLIPALTGPWQFYNAANRWDQVLWPNLPPALFPLDPNGAHFAIEKFWQGLPAGEPIPWGPWIRPLALWSVYVMATFGAMMAVMTIMRKQWVDHEHLSFPIAQVPAELCAATERGAGGGIFRSKLFWAGLSATFVLASLSGVAHYLGAEEVFFRVRETIEVSEGYELHLNVELVVIGLLFLVPNRVVFSVWLVALSSWVLKYFLSSYNLTLTDASMYGNSLQNVALGAAISFVVGSLWLARRHLLRVLRCALGRGEQDYDRGEAASYRTALLLLVAGVAGSAVWLRLAGLRWLYTVPLVLLTLVIYYTMARVVAQCGLPVLSPPGHANHALAAAFGSGNVADDQIALLGMQYGSVFDMRNSPMSGAAHGMYLTKRRRSGLLWAMLLALLVAFLSAAFMTVWIGYRKGGVNLDPYFFDTFPRWIPWNWAHITINQDGDPSYVRMILGGGGALLMALLTIAQRTFFWWPLHPVGLLVLSNNMVERFWLSIFLAWLAKAFLVWAGGYRAYRAGRRFCIGMVLGYFLAGGLWGIIDTLTETTGNAVFYI
ncbi:MAG: DUF6785 family protein [Candidatus Brocadiia bacterium]